MISSVPEWVERTFWPLSRCKKKNRFMNTAKEKTRSLDKALKLLTYGNYIVTTRVPAEKLDTRDEDYVAAGTVSWAMQSSFEPPMITLAVRKDSDLRETMERAGSFVLTILGKKDRELVGRFRGDSDIGDDQINGIGYSAGPETGNPVIEAGIAHFECEVSDRLESDGDHVLVVGRIVNVRENQEGTDPLYEWETGFQYGGVEFS